MGKFAEMAEEHWRRHLPKDYERIADKAAFFEEIEDEAMNQVEELEEHLRGQDPPGESFADRMGRFVRARATAEEIVVREVVLVAPSSPPAETTKSDSDAELEEAVTDFYSLRDQFYDDMNAEREGLGQSQEPDS